MTPQEEVIHNVTEAVRPIVEEALLELVEVEFRPTGQRWLVRVFIDKEGGVTIDDCAYVSRELSRLLEVEDFIEHAYMLEVSSPGLTRPLKKRRDFERSRGKLCRVVTATPIEGKTEFKGIISQVRDEVLEIRGDEYLYEVPMDVIKKAHLEFEV